MEALIRFFGHCRPIRDGAAIIGSIQSPVRVKTVEVLGSGYGPDDDKRLVVTAHRDDLLGVRPERTGRELFIKAKDLYALLVRRDAQRQLLEFARAKKAKRAAARAERRARRPVS